MTKMLQIDKEYAAALFMLAVEENKVSEYLRELEGVVDSVKENPEYIDFLGSPAVPLEERLSAIDEAFGESLSEYTLSFIKLLCENGRINYFYGCVREYAALTKAVANRTVANIYSVVPLSDEQKKSITEKIEGLTGKSVDSVYIIDKSLIGGLKIEVEGKTYDGSIKHRLNEVKEQTV